MRDPNPPLRLEWHDCQWAYAPIIGEAGEEYAMWACGVRWPDGARCSARTVDPVLITRTARGLITALSAAPASPPPEAEVRLARVRAIWEAAYGNADIDPNELDEALNGPLE